MRSVFFHVLMEMSTHPDSQPRMTKPSATFDANEFMARFRVRTYTRMIIGMRAIVMRDQSKAIKPA